MSEQKASESANNEKWQMFYWKLRNRGNWIRYLFEEAGIDYVDHSMLNTDIKKYFLAFSDGKANPSNDSMSAFAPPAVQKGNLFINQTEVVVHYLAQEFGMLPQQKLEQIQAQQLMANCNDLVREMYALRGKVYSDKKAINNFFENGRFDKWLSVIEKPLFAADVEEAEDVYYFDGKCTYIDLMVYNTVEGLHDFVGQLFPKLMEETHPLLIKHFKCIGKRKAVSALLSKQRELKWEWYSGKAFTLIRSHMGFV